MKPEPYHCPHCGFGSGEVERVCWDCRCKGAKAPKRREPAHAPVRGYRCDECGAVFSVLRWFDRHRVGQFERPGKPNTRRCLAPAEMRAIGLHQHPKTGIWKKDGGLEGVPKGAHVA